MGKPMKEWCVFVLFFVFLGERCCVSLLLVIDDDDEPINAQPKQPHTNKQRRKPQTKKRLRFSVAYWHTFRGDGGDPFGSPTKQWPWDDPALPPLQRAFRTMHANFEFLDKLGVDYWCFHDRCVWGCLLVCWCGVVGRGGVWRFFLLAVKPPPCAPSFQHQQRHATLKQQPQHNTQQTTTHSATSRPRARRSTSPTPTCKRSSRSRRSCKRAAASACCGARRSCSSTRATCTAPRRVRFGCCCVVAVAVAAVV